MLTEAPENTPGTQYAYSNAGYIVLGSALESLSGQSWEDQMEVLYREQLAAWRAEGGDRAPNTLVALSNLAVNLREQGKLAEAEPLFREALAAEREVNGNDALSTMQDAGALGKHLTSAELQQIFVRSNINRIDGSDVLVAPDDPLENEALVLYFDVIYDFDNGMSLKNQLYYEAYDNLSESAYGFSQFHDTWVVEDKLVLSGQFGSDGLTTSWQLSPSIRYTDFDPSVWLVMVLYRVSDQVQQHLLQWHTWHLNVRKCWIYFNRKPARQVKQQQKKKWLRCLVAWMYLFYLLLVKGLVFQP